MGKESLFFNARELDQELPECIGKGILSCQKVRPSNNKTKKKLKNFLWQNFVTFQSV
jgi:hypothetical protein